jgi:hypothetical protein
VPLENRTRCDLRFFGTSCGAGIFVNQAAQDRLPDDLCAVEVGNGEVTDIVFSADALVRLGRAVEHPVLK